MKFADLGLAEPLVRAVHEHGYDTPTPIQAQAIPSVLSGADVMGGAQTGTGKTAGFVLPMLHRLMAQPARRDARGRVPIRALILTPTRELAAQVEESVRVYGKHSTLIEHGHVRRRRHAAADRQAAARRRHPGRDAGPAARPPRPAHAGPGRRSRSSCSTRPTACSTWASSTTSRRCSRCCRRRSRACSFRPPSATTSRHWPTGC